VLMLSNHSSISLPAQINRENLEFILKKYEEKLRIYSKSPKPFIKLKAFAHSLNTTAPSYFLAQKQVFELCKILYDLELYDELHKNNDRHNVITQFVDQVFGAERSAGFRKLYGYEFKDTYLMMQWLGYSHLHKQEWHFHKFNELTFDTLCRIPAECTEELATILTSRNRRLNHETVCALTPNNFDVGYVKYLDNFIFDALSKAKTESPSCDEHTAVINSLPNSDYGSDTLYAYYWLSKGKIDSKSNKDKVNRFAESISCLAKIHPDEGSSEVEKQESYQDAFNKEIKKIILFKQSVILSGIVNTRQGAVIWKFFGAKPGNPALSNHALCEPQIIAQVLRYL